METEKGERVLYIFLYSKFNLGLCLHDCIPLVETLTAGLGDALRANGGRLPEGTCGEDWCVVESWTAAEARTHMAGVGFGEIVKYAEDVRRLANSREVPVFNGASCGL